MLQFNLYVLVLLVSALTAAWLAVYAFRHRSGPGRLELGWLMTGVTWWMFLSVLEAAFTSLPVKQAFGVAAYPGSQGTPVLFLLLALRFAQRGEHWNAWKKALLFVMPVVSTGMAATNDWHRLLWPDIRLIQTFFGGVTIVYQHGLWFWVEMVYNYAILAVGIIILIRAMQQFPLLFSMQSRILLAAALLPMVFNVLYAVSPQSTSGIELTGVGITWSAALLFWAVMRYRFLEQPTIAHNLMMDNLREGILLLDREGRVLDINLAMRRFFDLSPDILGKALEFPLEGCQQLKDFILSEPLEGRRTEFRLPGPPPRWLHLTLEPLRDGHGRLRGALLSAHDISDRRQTEAALRESEERYRLLAENQAEGITIVDSAGRFTFANPAAERILGAPPGGLEGRSLGEFASDEQIQALRAGRSEQVHPAANAQQIEFTRPDGERRVLEITTAPQFDTQGNYTASFGIIRDITKRRQAEEALHERQRSLSLLNEITTTALEAADMTGMLLALANRMGELLKAEGCYITLWDRVQQRPQPIAASGELQEVYPQMSAQPGEITMTESVLKAGHALVVEDVFNSPYISPRIAGLFPARSMLGLPLIAGGRKMGAVLISFNQPHTFTPEEVALGEQAAAQLSLALLKALLLQEAGLARDQAQDANRQLHRAMAELALLATTDRLTGAYNRHKLDELSTYEISRSTRYHHPLSLILIDIDHFKEVNDSYGHLVGDQVLVNLVTLLQTNIRDTDSLARWGGEEFVILCPGINGGQALQLAEKIRAVVSKHDFRPVGHITLSIGATELLPGESFDQGILRADEALYRAKENGRDRAELVSPDRQSPASPAG